MFNFLFQEIKLFSKQKGCFIVLVGPDGSGKTTTYELIRDKIYKRYFSDIVYYHRFFDVIPRISSILSKLTGRKIEKQEKLSETIASDDVDLGVTRYSALRCVIYQLYYWWDYLFGGFIIRKRKYKNKLVVFDRYYFDFFISSDFERAPGFAKYFYRYFITKPDLLVVMQARANVIFERKPELSVQEIKNQDARIQKIINVPGNYKNLVIVNTENGFDAVEKDIDQAIFTIKNAQ